MSTSTPDRHEAGRHRRPPQRSAAPTAVAIASLCVAATGAWTLPTAASGRSDAANVLPAVGGGEAAVSAAVQLDTVAVRRTAAKEHAVTHAERSAAARAEADAVRVRAQADRDRADRVRREREAEPAWAPPLEQYRMTSDFGPRRRGNHLGLDLAAPTGTPVRSIGAGTVTSAGYAGAYGNRVVVTHDDGSVSYYAHLSAIIATDGRVAPATVIGRVGSTGRSTGPHLHLEVRPAGGGPVDPQRWLGARDVAVGGRGAG